MRLAESHAHLGQQFDQPVAELRQQHRGRGRPGRPFGPFVDGPRGGDGIGEARIEREPAGRALHQRAGDAIDVGGEPGQRFEPLAGRHRSQPQGRGDVGVDGREATADPRPVHRPDLAAVAGPDADLRRLVVADDDGGRGERRGAIRGAGVREVRRDDLDRARQPARHPGVGVIAGHDPAADRTLGVTEPLEHQHQRRRGPAAALVARSLAGDAIVAAHAEQPAGSTHGDRAFVPFRSQSDDDHVHSEMSEPASLPARSQPRCRASALYHVGAHDERRRDVAALQRSRLIGGAEAPPYAGTANTRSRSSLQSGWSSPESVERLANSLKYLSPRLTLRRGHTTLVAKPMALTA